MFEAFDISDAVVVNLAPALYAVVRCLTDVVTAVNAESLAYSAFAHSHTSSFAYDNLNGIIGVFFVKPKHSASAASIKYSFLVHSLTSFISVQ